MPPSADLTLELDLQIACDPAPGLPSQAQLQSWAEAALRGRRNDAELSIRLVDEAESQTLNRDYRGKDKPTNVLSFPADLPPELELPLLGDLVVCRQVVEREAEEQHKAPHDHWAHMIIHGTLHLLGFDHIDDGEAEVMEALEIALLGQLGIDNPY
ncbi:rRNA maturation RNase YbeY [Spongiibacter sp.]|uniref:rRNA maturation RNase YbeY n=1 Tax=Spongiibacter TaxID=630749 RepID=UPI00257DBBAD|nr:rRNA maturation RNase YbeY [Spongiibacter sp.]